jgi:hypothetical protein
MIGRGDFADVVIESADAPRMPFAPMARHASSAN